MSFMFLRFNPKREAHPLQTTSGTGFTGAGGLFQSQTGSPSSSDPALAISRGVCRASFNPKREAHPLQTRDQSALALRHPCVSIPNGKPILFRPTPGRLPPRRFARFNPKREAHPLQTPYISFTLLADWCFNPKREAHPLQTATSWTRTICRSGFNPKREAHPLQTQKRCRRRDSFGMFQSQTGSPSSLDVGLIDPGREEDLVSIPNGKPILFRRQG